MLTESNSHHQNLDKMPIISILEAMNQEDQSVPLAVQKAIPQIEKTITAILERMKNGGRLFYIGAGTSGRLGVVDASECPPTFGVPDNLVIGLIAGGDKAIRKAVEFAEDNFEQAWEDLQTYQISKNDSLIGIAASGRTPYVIGGIKKASENGILTACIVCNENSILANLVEYPIEVIVGAEFLTGSTRLKAGTAQKLVLNMISTTLMIGLGRVKGNKMVNMQLSNQKLIQRGTQMLVDELGLDEQTAKELLLKYGSVQNVLNIF